jgi:hypothetical protein
MNLFRNDSGAVGVRVGPTKLYLWSGGWSIFDRSGASKFSLRQCACHRFTLLVGPVGVEVHFPGHYDEDGYWVYDDHECETEP